MRGRRIGFTPPDRRALLAGPPSQLLFNQRYVGPLLGVHGERAQDPSLHVRNENALPSPHKLGILEPIDDVARALDRERVAVFAVTLSQRGQP
jgi:hypothetical protein